MNTAPGNHSPALFDAGPARHGTVTRNTAAVTISDVHLKTGVPGSEGWCALGVALREELAADDLNDEVEVTADYVRVALRHGSWWAQTTPELYQFIRDFDSTADENGDQDPTKLEALQARASAGLLRFPLTWHEGDPPQGHDDI
jgi:hypothetical protein